MIDSQSRSMDNQKESLRTLGRSISLSQGEFAIILLHCNYELLRQHVVEQLPKYCTVPFQELFLSPSTQTLYQAIQAEIDQEESPNALMAIVPTKGPRKRRQKSLKLSRYHQTIRLQSQRVMLQWICLTYRVMKTNGPNPKVKIRT